MLPSGTRVFVCAQPTDMRKSFDGLIAATQHVLKHNPLSGDLYLFVNRKATMVKGVYWTRGGFCLWAKRLERGRFASLPGAQAGAGLTDTQLMMWLDGIELASLRQTKRFVLPAGAPTSGIIRA